MNKNLILISGTTGTGKTSSLRNIAEDSGIIYMNADSGKKPTFKNNFNEFVITDPYQLYQGILDAPSAGYHTMIIDTVTYMMDLFESKHIVTADDTRKAWGDYTQFFKTLMNQYVASSPLNFIFLAHTKKIINTMTAKEEVTCNVKASLKDIGLESFFSTVLSTKVVDVDTLKNYENPYLNISEEEQLLGYKYVFQTRLTRETINERIKSPMNMWTTPETYIDNDVKIVLDRLHSFYG